MAVLASHVEDRPAMTLRRSSYSPIATYLRKKDQEEANMPRITALFVGALLCACSPRMPSTKMVGLEPAVRPLTCAADADCGSAQLCVDRSCFDVATATEARC